MPALRDRYHHGDLRHTLLSSVGRIIRKRGVAFVSLREVARDARVSHSAPAHHFRNKAGLLTAFATNGFQRLGEMAIAEVAKAKKDAPSQLEALGRGYVRFAITNSEQFLVMFRSELLDADDEKFVAASDGAYSLLTSMIERCAREGYLAGCDNEAVAVAAWSVAHGAAMLWIGGRLPKRVSQRDGMEVAARALKAFVDGTIRSTRQARKPSARAASTE